jgi:hypothetical protein
MMTFGVMMMIVRLDMKQSNITICSPFVMTFNSIYKVLNDYIYFTISICKLGKIESSSPLFLFQSTHDNRHKPS